MCVSRILLRSSAKHWNLFNGDACVLHKRPAIDTVHASSNVPVLLARGSPHTLGSVPVYAVCATATVIATGGAAEFWEDCVGEEA